MPKRSVLPSLDYLKPEFYLVRIELTTEMLGTVPKSQTIHKDYVQAKATQAAKKLGQEIPEEWLEEELRAAADPDAAEKEAWTGFMADPDDRDRVFIMNYMINGFIKEAVSGLRFNPESLSAKLTAFKKVITSTCFPYPRRLYFHLPEGQGLGINSRPLRADTAQGPRVALATSDTVPAGAWFDVLFKLLAPKRFGEKHLKEALQLGASKGLGQWRSGFHGRFVVTSMKCLSLDEALATGMILDHEV